MPTPSLGPSNRYSCFWSGVFPGIDAGGREIINIETIYFDAKTLQFTNTIHNSQVRYLQKAQKEWIKRTEACKYDRHLSDYFSLLDWWRSIYNSTWIHHTAHVQKLSFWNCVSGVIIDAGGGPETGIPVGRALHTESTLGYLPYAPLWKILSLNETLITALWEVYIKLFLRMFKDHPVFQSISTVQTDA